MQDAWETVFERISEMRMGLPLSVAVTMRCRKSVHPLKLLLVPLDAICAISHTRPLPSSRDKMKKKNEEEKTEWPRFGEGHIWVKVVGDPQEGAMAYNTFGIYTLIRPPVVLSACAE